MVVKLPSVLQSFGMNPYAVHLGDQDPIQVVSSTAGRLSALIRALGTERAEWAPAPGKWSARQILCHLADTELVFAFRLRQTLAEPLHVIQPFDQEKWAANYAAYETAAALAVFSAVRGWNLNLLGAVPPSVFSKRVTHPERGEMTFKVLIETMAGHDLNHLKQIEAISARAPKRSD
jgi:hypothetical protein